MTAEIAIINKQAIALAADSAITLQTGKGQKIFTSANKIFSLSRNHPVGIMVYGNASFLQVPWETIIKLYTKKLGSKEFRSLDGYATSFLRFIEKDRQLFPKEEQEKYIKGSIQAYFIYVRKRILDTIRSKLEENKKTDIDGIKKIISDTISKEYNGWKKTPFLPGIPKNKIVNFTQKYQTKIRKLRKDIFEKLPINTAFSDKLKQIGVWLFFKFNEGISYTGASGIVIAGFGKNDIFPCLRSYVLEGIANGYLKLKNIETADMDFETGAVIIPFAQKDMTTRFIEGVDPYYLQIIDGGLHQLSNKYPELILGKIKISNKRKKTKLIKEIKKQTQKITNRFLKQLEEIRRERYVDPILFVVGILPKDELATMAETLITLTSFKRRVSMDEETVAGPVDVVVISKGDGFVWIKRKEYFSRNINPENLVDYFYQKEDEKK